MRWSTAAWVVLCVGCASEPEDLLDTPPPPPPAVCTLPELGRLELGHSENLDVAADRVERNGELRGVDFSVEGIFAEHDTMLPNPCCDGPLCLHAELGIVPDVDTAEPVRVVRVGVNLADPEEEVVDVRRNLFVAVDLSASLRTPESTDLIRRMLGGLIDGLHPEDRLSLITFRNQPRIEVELAEVGNDRTTLHTAVSELEFGGATNLWGGLEGALFLAVTNFDAERENRVLLITDGRPTWGVSNAEEVVRETYGFVRQGVLLSIVGVGDAQVDTLTRRVGGAADGLFHSILDADDADAFVAAQLASTWRAIAKDLALEITRTGAFTADIAGVDTSRWDGDRIRLERPVLLEGPGGALRTPGHGDGGGSMITLRLDGGLAAGERLFATRLVFERGEEEFEQRIEVSVDFDTASPPMAAYFDSPEMEYATLVDDIGRRMVQAGLHFDRHEHSLALDDLYAARARIDGWNAVHGPRADLDATLQILERAIGEYESDEVEPTKPAPGPAWPSDGVMPGMQ